MYDRFEGSGEFAEEFRSLITDARLRTSLVSYDSIFAASTAIKRYLVPVGVFAFKRSRPESASSRAIVADRGRPWATVGDRERSGDINIFKLCVNSIKFATRIGLVRE